MTAYAPWEPQWILYPLPPKRQSPGDSRIYTHASTKKVAAQVFGNDREVWDLISVLFYSILYDVNTTVTHVGDILPQPHLSLCPDSGTFLQTEGS